MTPKQVISALTVAELGSVQQAASALHLAPSSISAQLKELRQELGIALFEPQGRGLVISRQGHQLLPKLKAFADLHRSILQDACDLNQEAAGALFLFSPSSMCMSHVPKLIRALSEIAPKIVLHVVEEEINYYEALQARTLDAAIIIHNQPLPCEISSHRLSVEPVAFVCASARYRPGRWRREDLLAHPLIMTEPQCSYHRVAANDFAAAGFTLAPLHTFSNVEVIRRCVRQDIGIGLLPLSAVQEDLQAGQLQQLDVIGSPYTFTADLGFLRTAQYNPRLQALVQALEHCQLPALEKV